MRSTLAQGLIALCDTMEASSVHVTFAREDEWRSLAEYGFLQRTDQQFHWRNEGYASFDDFRVIRDFMFHLIRLVRASSPAETKQSWARVIATDA